MRLILASASPRRAELLRAAGIPFEVSTVEIDERFRSGESPEKAVARLAQSKAAAVAASQNDAIVLGADTTVVDRQRGARKAGECMLTPHACCACCQDARTKS